MTQPMVETDDDPCMGAGECVFIAPPTVRTRSLGETLTLEHR